MYCSRDAGTFPDSDALVRRAKVRSTRRSHPRSGWPMEKDGFCQSFASSKHHSTTKKAPAKPGPSNLHDPDRSARIEFDDQMRLHLHRERHVGECGDADELRGHLGMIDLDVVGHVALAKLVGFEHEGELLGGFLDLDEVAGLNLIACDIDLAAIGLDVAVVDELARGEHRGDEL